MRPSRECIQSNGGQLISTANGLGAVSIGPTRRLQTNLGGLNGSNAEFIALTV